MKLDLPFNIFFSLNKRGLTSDLLVSAYPFNWTHGPKMRAKFFAFGCLFALLLNASN